MLNLHTLYDGYSDSIKWIVKNKTVIDACIIFGGNVVIFLNFNMIIVLSTVHNGKYFIRVKNHFHLLIAISRALKEHFFEKTKLRKN